MAFSLTSEQQAAVDNRGGGLLVSAAAGSGKTWVLVERLLARVEGEGLDIDRFLVITYTKAAAAELRGRIVEELSARLEGADPFLRTAFCLEVFRERQLLTLRQEGDTISITLTGQGKHVRLEESGYLQGLHEVMQPKRGGDHHD